mgnify:FL=1|tara:strand:+ start:280 stop:753 length:474 start_codon:yes stop_codon:yes gene_type:complete
MAKRIGLGRTQALIEGLKRELQLNQSTLKGTLQQVVTLSGAGATATLTSDDSGAIVEMGGSNASTVNLPAVEKGLYFRFVATTAHAHVIQGGDTSIEGGYHHNTNAATVARVAVTNKSKLTLHNSNAAKGDTLEMWCNGTDWFVSGIVNDVITQAPA